MDEATLAEEIAKRLKGEREKGLKLRIQKYEGDNYLITEETD